MGSEQTAAERLRAWRMGRGLTLESLAEQLRCSDSWISLIERGLKQPGSCRLALAIEQLTGIDAADWPDPAERKPRRLRSSKTADEASV